MQNTFLSIFILVTIGIFPLSTHCVTLIIYEHVGRQGDSLQVTVEGCAAFPVAQSWNDRVSSVDNKGRCVTLHENKDCTGRYIDLLPGDANQFDLYTAKFDDIASSASPCTRDYRGAYMEEGVYYIESAEDESAITTDPLRAGQFLSRVVLEDSVDLKTQRWSISKNHNSPKSNGYFLTSAINKSNPITMNVRSQGGAKNVWHFLPGLGSKYMIYRHTNRGGNICLLNRGFGNHIGETLCEHNARRQQWILRKVDSDQK